MSSRLSLHDTDFYAWAKEQADLLRAGRVGEADLAFIAEEIESMGKTEKRELVSRLTVLLLHLLKWKYQPVLRGNSWRLSIANARDEIADLIADNPSLRAQIAEVTASAYRYARRRDRSARRAISTKRALELCRGDERGFLAGLTGRCR